MWLYFMLKWQCFQFHHANIVIWILYNFYKGNVALNNGYSKINTSADNYDYISKRSCLPTKHDTNNFIQYNWANNYAGNTCSKFPVKQAKYFRNIGKCIDCGKNASY